MRIECPICKKVIENASAEWPVRPFCSPRCKLVDLHNWLNEGYRVSSDPDPDWEHPDREETKPRHN